MLAACCHFPIKVLGALKCVENISTHTQPVNMQMHTHLLLMQPGFDWYHSYAARGTRRLGKVGGAKTFNIYPYVLLTLLISVSFFCLSGRYVENHGVIHNMWFNTTTQEKKGYYMTQFVDSYWDNGSLPIWITAQRQGLKAGSLHFPGTAATYKGETVRLREVEPRLYDYSNETEWRLNIDKVIGEWFHQQDLDFVSLYFGEPDGTGHRYGPDSPERREMVQQVDRTVGYIRDKIQDHCLTDRLNVIITADHGMTTVLRGAQVEEMILYKIPGFNFSDIQFHLVDYGPVGMLLPKDGMLEKLHILTLFHNSWFSLAVGPDFQKDLVVGPFETVNVYPLMCHLLGINPEINDGHLDNTKQMLLPKKNTEGNNSTGKFCAIEIKDKAPFLNVLLFAPILFVWNVVEVFHLNKACIQAVSGS
uniref:Ectonucleotide pyrophosphatase/phosphodiesterase 7, tandem duplicate 2 n=1 Tax=Haplochromis burtoni TaxID=8153 RepID=A0A3Q2WAM2_HAPBU